MINKPIMLQKIDLSNLQKVCQEYIDTASNGFADSPQEEEDYQMCVMETAMETFFGVGVWDWINS